LNLYGENLVFQRFYRKLSKTLSDLFHSFFVPMYIALIRNAGIGLNAFFSTDDYYLSESILDNYVFLALSSKCN